MSPPEERILTVLMRLPTRCFSSTLRLRACLGRSRCALSSGRSIATLLARGLSWTSWAVCLLVLLRSASAADFYEPFDAAAASWELSSVPRGVRVVEQARELAAGRVRGAEVVRLNVSRDGVQFEMQHPLVPCRTLDEFTASLWLKCERPGVTLSVALVAPGTNDPESGKPLELLVAGDTYQESGKWSELRCRTSEKAVNERLQLLRARSQMPLEAQQFVVDHVVLGGRLSPGTMTLAIDELRAAPVIELEGRSDESSAGEGPSAKGEAVPPVEFRLDRMQVQGKPFFPRIVPYHGERPELLAELGFNIVWIPRHDDTELMARLRACNLWVAAIPPHPQTTSGGTLDAGQAGLIPFDRQSEAIALWMMGTRLSTAGRGPLLDWITQVQDADRAWRRPVAADVVHDEKLYSRHVDLLGISRHVVHTSFRFPDYLQWLRERRSIAKPGSFCWTWLQVEPHVAGQSEAVAVIEPEQIRLQAYAAIAAGCRGLGFWTTRSLEDDHPASRETRLAIQQVNTELRLLEPWLATIGSVTDAQFLHTSAVSAPGTSSPGGLSLLGVGRSAAAGAKTTTGASAVASGELTATMLRTDYGTVLLPLWLAEGAQYCPPQSAMSGSQLIVPGAGDFITAYEIATTGSVHTLQTKPGAGGRRIDLPQFDQSAAILMTPDRGIIQRLRQSVEIVSPMAARNALELAKAKLDRVGRVHDRLEQLSVASPDGPRRLGQARLLLDRAEAAYQSRDLPTARERSNEAMQALRLLQRQQWDNAVAALGNPMGTPYSVCFQTLPEHYELMGRYAIAQTRPTRELLRSGNFEDFDTLLAEGWSHEQPPVPGVQATGELSPGGFNRSRYALRLAAAPAVGKNVQPTPARPTVVVTTPELTVHAGQLVRIRGQVRLSRAVEQSRDGFMLFDSLGGKPLALRWHDAQEWRGFEVLREVSASQALTITLMLCGWGDVQVDDLMVEVMSDGRDEGPRAVQTVGHTDEQPGPRSAGGRPASGGSSGSRTAGSRSAQR